MQNESNNTNSNTNNNSQTPASQSISSHEAFMQYARRCRAASRRFSDEWEQDPDTGKWFPVADRE